MKRHWHPRRALLPTPDGQQRWDRAYQALLTWTMPATETPQRAASPVPVGQDGEERGSGDRDLCARVDAAAGADADD